jgi:H/ACA ribonucleoprotein complex subunit 3
MSVLVTTAETLGAVPLTRLLKKCPRCGQYTMNPTVCPKCGEHVVGAHPPRFSIEDRYGKYRRQMKRALLTGQKQADDATTAA